MVHITDANALDALVSIEGEAWRTEQSRFGDYSFDAALAAWHKAVDYVPLGDDDDVIWSTAVCFGWAGVIYGAGGWRRYGIDNRGNLYPMRSSFSSPEGYERALHALGRSA